ncbi:MAG: aspartyl/asparaginyl beta-hydroxylase domain-containing protein [Bacteroidota bacterium]
MKEKNITKHLRLPFKFEEKALLKDLEKAQQNSWGAHYVTSGYEGEWKILALHAPHGDPTNIFANHSENELGIKETPVIKDCHYFKKVIASFQCDFQAVRLMKLGVGAYIKPHTDHNLGYDDGCFRLHIPITTNQDVEFLLDGKRLIMNPGECWYTNVNYTHSVANRGKTERVHLVIDGLRNEWSDQVFFSAAPKESFFPEKEDFSAETMRQIIESLKFMDSPKAKELIASYETKLAELKDG